MYLRDARRRVCVVETVCGHVHAGVGKQSHVQRGEADRQLTVLLHHATKPIRPRLSRGTVTVPWHCTGFPRVRLVTATTRGAVRLREPAKEVGLLRRRGGQRIAQGLRQPVH